MEHIENFISKWKVPYETSDAAEIVVLLYFGMEPVDIASHDLDKHRKIFHFETTKELDAILERLAHGRLLVEPSKFLNAHKNFKDSLRRCKQISQKINLIP